MIHSYGRKMHWFLNSSFLWHHEWTWWPTWTWNWVKGHLKKMDIYMGPRSQLFYENYTPTTSLTDNLGIHILSQGSLDLLTDFRIDRYWKVPCIYCQVSDFVHMWVFRFMHAQMPQILKLEWNGYTGLIGEKRNLCSRTNTSFTIVQIRN